MLICVSLHDHEYNLLGCPGSNDVYTADNYEGVSVAPSKVAERKYLIHYMIAPKCGNFLGHLQFLLNFKFEERHLYPVEYGHWLHSRSVLEPGVAVDSPLSDDLSALQQQLAYVLPRYLCFRTFRV